MSTFGAEGLGDSVVPYECLVVSKDAQSMRIAIHRPESRNALNGALLQELNAALDVAEQTVGCHAVVIEGEDGVFCTGMDFREMLRPDSFADAERMEALDTLYIDTLRRISLSPRAIIAHVDGQVMAGGVGLVAACDLVVATERSQFSLSEALWGLLPACVAPYLIRRVGFQKAYRLTLTSQTVDAREALQMNLVDQVCEDSEDALRRNLIRLCRLDETTVRDMKAYFRKMWLIDASMERTAVDEITRLLLQPRVRENIGNFVKYRRFPWEKAE